MILRLEVALGLLRSGRSVRGALLAALLGVAGAVTEARAVDILTQHYDTQRTGWNAQETMLTPASVQDPSFGVLYTVSLDDHVDAQPLVVTDQPISGVAGNRTVAYVATHANSVYAIDAASGQILLKTNLGSPVPMSNVGGCGNNGANLGIGATPVIDRAAGLLYVVAYTFDGTNPSYTLHALSLSTLADALPPVLITAAQGLDDGSIYTFDPSASRLRAGLLLANGNIYAGFSSFCDFFADRSRGWVLGWNAGTLQPLGFDRLNDHHATSPTAFFLTSVWMSGNGIAAGPDGSLFFTTGNSDTAPTYDSVANPSESLLKVSPDLATMQDFFTPFEVNELDFEDLDFGSGGVLLLPPQPGAATSYAVAAGKSGKMYLIDRQNLGNFTPGGPDNVVGTFAIGGACWCAPSYFTGSDGVGRIVSSADATPIIWQLQTAPTVALVQQNVLQQLNSGQDPGFFTSVSSNGTQDGTALIWAVSRPIDASGAVQLYVFDARDGTLDFQAQAGTWLVPQGNANIVPVVANGQIFVATTKQLTVFGLGAPVSADGSVLTVSSGGTLRTTDGNWTFNTIVDAGGNEIDLNGRQAADGAGVKLVVARGGHMFAQNNQANWFEWQSGSWSPSTDPTGATSSAPPPVSADGSVLTPGAGGSLVTTDGTWTFSANVLAGGNEIDLNAQRAADGSGVKLVVAQGGHLFALNNAGSWFEWQSGSWSPTSDPTATPPTSGAGSPIGAAAVTASAAGTATDGTWSKWHMTSWSPASRPTAAKPGKPGRTSEHQVSGTITWTDGNAALTVRTRSGRFIAIDGMDAHDAHQSLPLVVGETVTASGVADGQMLRARTIMRAKESSALWPPDR